MSSSGQFLSGRDVSSHLADFIWGLPTPSLLKDIAHVSNRALWNPQKLTPRVVKGPSVQNIPSFVTDGLSFGLDKNLLMLPGQVCEQQSVLSLHVWLNKGEMKANTPPPAHLHTLQPGTSGCRCNSWVNFYSCSWSRSVFCNALWSRYVHTYFQFFDI